MPFFQESIFYGGQNRIKLDRAGYLRVALATILIMGSIFLYVFEFRVFNRTLNIGWLLLISALVGGTLGYYISRKFSKGINETYERMRIYMVCIAMCVLFTPLYLSLINRFLDFSEPEIISVEFLSSSARISERFGNLKGVKNKIDHYAIVVVIDDQPVSFRTKKDYFSEFKEGEIVDLKVNQGLLGVRYITFAQ